MVQVLPTPTNAGTQIGAALGQGLQGGLNQALQQQYQAGKLREAFQKVQGLSDPAQIAMALGEASIYSPNADRSLAALAPLLIGQNRVSQLFGGQGGGAQGQQMPGQQQQQPPGQSMNDLNRSMMQEEGSPLSRGISAPGKQKEGGYLQPPMTPEEQFDFAKRYAGTLASPEKILEGQQIAAVQNKSRMEALTNMENIAKGQGVSSQDMPIYMQLAQKYSHLTDPNKIANHTQRDYEQYRNKLDSLDNAFFPGYGTAFKNLNIPGEKSPSHYEVRDAALNKLNPQVRDLVKLGPEAENKVRQKLADKGLSRTEIEERIRPMPIKTEQAIKSIPSAKGLSSDKQHEQLVKFFQSSVTPETALTVARHKLWNDKGYNWEDIASAIDESGIISKLTPQQSTELSEISQPPRQSLSDIFFDWDRWLDLLKGAK